MSSVGSIVSMVDEHGNEYEVCLDYDAFSFPTPFEPQNNVVKNETTISEEQKTN